MKPKKGIALVLGAEPDGDEEEAGEGMSEAGEGEEEAMEAFTSAKTNAAKAAALKAFIKLCMSSGDYE